ncbi:MAG: long-chain fatty acid--CoA ligase, partial [Comamonadaceae bacterium]
MRPIDFLLRAARLHPGKTAVAGPEGSITYADLVAQVEALAVEFQQRVPAEDGRIAICAGNHIAHVVALFATLLAGRIWVPLNPRAGQPELSRIVAFTEAALVVTEDAHAAKVADAGAPVMVYRTTGGDDDLRAAVQRHRGTVPAPVHPDLARTQAIKFTGGTTGLPKGVMQSLRSWNTCIVSIMRAMRLDEDVRYLAV